MINKRILRLISGVCLLTCALQAQTTRRPADYLSLAGQWSVTLDPDSTGEAKNLFNRNGELPIRLPGTLDDAGYGTPTAGSDYGILTRKHKYTGPAWYTREFVVPGKWQGREIVLHLERVMWESKVWIDGRPADTQDGLGTPHLHRLGVLKPGKHRITVRVNNDMIYTIGDKGHSYGEYTQIIWNGMIGKIEVEALPALSIDRIQVWPDASGKQLAVAFDLKGRSPKTKGDITYSLKELPEGREVLSFTETVTCDSLLQPHGRTLSLTTPVRLWDNLHPHLYRLDIHVGKGTQEQQKSVEFGFRDITASRSKIQVNGRSVFMRGNLDCLHFPLTGYPSCDVPEWERIFRIYKSYGLNHVRFHSWCPPEAAFAAADKVGIYIQAEVLWIDWWMSVINPERPEMTTRGLPPGLGHNPSADAFVPAELQRMIEAYGNHPSFAMLCIGNELGNSDFDVMQQWILPLHKDNRRLYAVSTARKITPADQFMATHNIPGIGGTYGITGTGTEADREATYSQASIPVIAHELGQYPVYPLWSEIHKYTGVLEPRNLEELRQSARRNGIEYQDRIFHEASGALQSLLYKGLIENLLRTSSCAGFQMLSMTDYSGQGEALVGWLDSFWDSKGVITPEQFRSYSNDVVPLARFAKYVWQTDETFKALLQVANYGASGLTAPVEWTLSEETGRLLQRGRKDIPLPAGRLTTVDSLAVGLAVVDRPGRYLLDVTVSGTDYHNRWPLWIYPPCELPETGALVTDIFDQKAVDHLNAGGNVLLMAHQSGWESNTCPLYFEPLFWSTSFFPGQSNKTLGAWIDKAHPALACFPTDAYTDWQWKTITKGRSFIVNNHPELTPIVQPVSDFHINDKLASLFECRTGKGKLLVCGYDLDTPSPVAQQLKYSLLHYMGQSSFNPSYEMRMEELEQMFYYTPKAVVSVPEGFENSALYVLCGNRLAADGSTPWNLSLDKVEIQEKSCSYTVACDDTWKDETGTAWTGREITVEIETPNGITGDLYVCFEDWNRKNRAGIVSIEGRESLLENLRGKERWIKLFVMREDTNDGKIVFKARTTAGGNLMISRIALIKSM